MRLRTGATSMAAGNPKREEGPRTARMGSGTMSMPMGASLRYGATLTTAGDGEREGGNRDEVWGDVDSSGRP